MLPESLRPYVGQRVKAHRNRQRGNWTVICARTDRVVGYASVLTLTEARFHVQPGGLRRYRTTGHRTVFAYIAGTLTDATGMGLPYQSNLALFCPKVDDAFRIVIMGEYYLLRDAPRVDFLPDGKSVRVSVIPAMSETPVGRADSAGGPVIAPAW
mgnify:CR=1 FL=1